MKKIISLAFLFVIAGCNQQQSSPESGLQSRASRIDWKQQFESSLPLLGHRNWIVVADKAFPQQNAAGIEYINTDEELLPVLEFVLGKINASTHVRPIIFRDKELEFITEDQVKGVGAFRTLSEKAFHSSATPKESPVGKAGAFQTLLHDSVFVKLDAASKLFRVLVLKTNGTIPYSSVFLQLDCAYWNANQEHQLRESMK
jgi:hypothetical protein